MIQAFEAAPVLAGLKDFQRATVDYVFSRLYEEGASGRFLVADEVGLGKTLVAKGVIARTLEHLYGSVERIDIIYVCSNAAIAKQNLNRLSKQEWNKKSVSTRLTLLPVQLGELSKNKVNFITLTPGTAFDHGRRLGNADERLVIYFMLLQLPLGQGERKKLLQRGLRNLLRGKCTRKSWLHRVKHSDIPDKLSLELSKKFRKAVLAHTALYKELKELCELCQHHAKKLSRQEKEASLKLVGELRNLLAHECLHALEPDLVVLDEFQRFRELLHGEDEAALLAKNLFDYKEVRVLLLSATPYKMLSLDHEKEDDHYPDFLRTLSFLFRDDAQVEAVKQEIQAYRQALYGAELERVTLKASALALQERLLQVMCRTERVAMTAKLDAMLVEHPTIAPLTRADLAQAQFADTASRLLQAGDAIEYWKSGPYLLNYLKRYQMRTRLDALASAPPDALVALLQNAGGNLLKRGQFQQYAEVQAGNPRMRALLSQTLDKGLWQLLWLQPSLAYTQPAGAYESMRDLTKVLVFSAWSMVPDAIASLASYEAERRMLGARSAEITHGELSDRLKPLLRFARTGGRLTGMPVLAWMMPSAVLAGGADPLSLALELGRGEAVPVEALLRLATERCRALLDSLPKGSEGNRQDKRWYWAAPAMLDFQADFQTLQNLIWKVEASDEAESVSAAFIDHLAQMKETIARPEQLGPRPDDLAEVLAEMAIGAPGTCALRALQRIAPDLKADAPALLSAAARVAEGFRTLFNLPEALALLRGEAEEEERYWRLTLRYAIDGNLQAVLDEQVHILEDILGLREAESPVKVEAIAERLQESLSLRSANVHVDELELREGRLHFEAIPLRSRFALRFSEVRQDNQQSLNRTGAVSAAFNSPFRPFILASTSIGQEGLDFHPWCHAVMHWNLPSNPVDLEQREGRVQRYKNHAVRKNVAQRYGLKALLAWDGHSDPWEMLFQRAAADRPEDRSELFPYWIFEDGDARIERRIPLLPFSKEVAQLERLKRGLALYRMVFGQPRQEELLAHLSGQGLDAAFVQAQRIALLPKSAQSRKGEALPEEEHHPAAGEGAPALLT